MSCSARKRKASALDRNTKITFTERDHLSASAPYQEIFSSWSPVRKEMIRPIKSLDDMLMSSYRASLSHHSYASLDQSDKIDIHSNTEDISFNDTEELTQLPVEDINIDDKKVNQKKMHKAKDNTLVYKSGFFGQAKDKILQNTYSETMIVKKIQAHKFYPKEKATPSMKKIITNNQANFVPKSHVKQESKNSGNFSSITVTESISRRFSPASRQISRTCSCDRVGKANEKNSIAKWKVRRSTGTPTKGATPLLSSHHRPNILQSKRTNTVMEDGLIINTNVRDLSAHRNKLSMSLVISVYSLLLLCKIEHNH